MFGDRGARHGRHRRRRPPDGVARHTGGPELPDAGRRSHALAAARRRRGVRDARHRRVRVRLRHVVHRPPGRLRPASAPDRQAPRAADAVLRPDGRRRRAVEGHVRRAPARLRRVRHDHDSRALVADDRRQLRLAHVAQLAAHADDPRRAAGRGRHDPLLQQAAAPYRARHPDAHRQHDARAGGDDRRSPDRAGVRRRELRARPRRARGERAARLDDQAVRGERREHADHAGARRRGRRLHHLGRARTEPGRPPRPADVHVLRRGADHAARAAEGALRHQRVDPARPRRGREPLRPARPRRRARPRHRHARRRARRALATSACRCAIRAPTATRSPT